MPIAEAACRVGAEAVRRFHGENGKLWYPADLVGKKDIIAQEFVDEMLAETAATDCEFSPDGEFAVDFRVAVRKLCSVEHFTPPMCRAAESILRRYGETIIVPTPAYLRRKIERRCLECPARNVKLCPIASVWLCERHHRCTEQKPSRIHLVWPEKVYCCNIVASAVFTRVYGCEVRYTNFWNRYSVGKLLCSTHTAMAMLRRTCHLRKLQAVTSPGAISPLAAMVGVSEERRKRRKTMRVEPPELAHQYNFQRFEALGEGGDDAIYISEIFKLHCTVAGMHGRTFTADMYLSDSLKRMLTERFGGFHPDMESDCIATHIEMFEFYRVYNAAGIPPHWLFQHGCDWTMWKMMKPVLASEYVKNAFTEMPVVRTCPIDTMRAWLADMGISARCDHVKWSTFLVSLDAIVVKRLTRTVPHPVDWCVDVSMLNGWWYLEHRQLPARLQEVPLSVAIDVLRIMCPSTGFVCFEDTIVGKAPLMGVEWGVFN